MAHRGLALITGGCGGLGMAFAKRWLESGGRCVRLVDFVSGSAGAEAAGGLEQLFGPGRAEFVQCDVTDGEALKAAFGDGDGLGLVVNNAGIVSESGDAFDKWERQIAINLGGVVNGTRLALDAFAARRGPDGFDDGDCRVVVNVASMAGLIPTPKMAVYTATKFGVVGFSRAMHIEARRAGVRVHALCPSFTDTNMVNEETMRTDPIAKRTVDVFGGLMTADFVADAMYDKLVFDADAKAVLRLTPVEGVAYDAPALHPAEKAIRNALIKDDPVKFLKRALGYGRRRPSSPG